MATEETERFSASMAFVVPSLCLQHQLSQLYSYTPVSSGGCGVQGSKLLIRHLPVTLEVGSTHSKRKELSWGAFRIVPPPNGKMAASELRDLSSCVGAKVLFKNL